MLYIETEVSSDIKKSGVGQGGFGGDCEYWDVLHSDLSGC